MSSIRLQVLVPPGLDARIRKAAQRSGVSKGEWVRRALETVLAGGGRGPDPVARLSSLGAPTADIEKMLAEKRPCVVDFHIEPEENVWPMVPAGKSLNEMDGLDILESMA